MHLRVDRITEVQKLKSPSRHFSEVSEYKTGFDVADYCRKAFNMYGGNKQKAEFRCKNSLLESIIDRFGSDISFFADGKDHFRFLTDAHISEGLIGWILQYSGEMEILSPAELRSSIAQKVAELSDIYLK